MVFIENNNYLYIKQELIDGLRQTKNLDQAWAVYRKKLSSLGAYSSLYVWSVKPSAIEMSSKDVERFTKGMHVISDFPKQYLVDYEENNLASKDVETLHAFESDQPKPYYDEKEMKQFGSDAKKAWQIAYDHNLVAGMTSPIRSECGHIVGGIGHDFRGVSFKEFKSFFEDYGQLIHELNLIFHHHCFSNDLFNEKIKLTEKELDVIKYVAWGRQDQEIADRLNISVKAVEARLRRAKDKLSASDRTHLVVKAMILGYI